MDPSLRQVVLSAQDDNFLQTLPLHMIAEAVLYREVHARRTPTNRNPTAFAVEQGLPDTGISQYEALGPDGKVKALICPLFMCGRPFKRMEDLKRHLVRTHSMSGKAGYENCAGTHYFDGGYVEV